MTTSKIIAALVGPTLLVSALSLFANIEKAQAIVGGLSQSPALVMIAGYAAFVPGLAIVYFHNRWSGWPALVSAMGWLSLVVGAVRMVFPVELASMAARMTPSAAAAFPAFGAVFLLIGGFLTYKGFAGGASEKWWGK